MKPSFVSVTVALVLATASSWAQTNSFQVDISGTITRDADKFSVKTVNLLSSPSNILVMTTIQGVRESFGISIDEIDPTVTQGATNVVQRLFANGWDAVQVGAKGNFASGFWGENGAVSFNPRFPGFASQVNVSDIQFSPINKGCGRC